MVIGREPSRTPAPLHPRTSLGGASIVSASIRGPHRRPTPNPRDRLALATRIVDAITASDWAHLDAVLLPGGFLRMPDPIGHLDPGGRRAALMERSAVVETGQLSARLPTGCTLVMGVDFKPRSKRIGGDQFVTAWRDGTLVWDCQDFRVRAAILDPMEVPDGTTQSPPHS